MSAVLRVLLALLLILIGAAGGWLIRDAQRPGCPTEDSCVVDYYDGRWHITEVQP